MDVMAQKIITAPGDPLKTLIWKNGGRPEISEDSDGYASLIFEVMCKTELIPTLVPARNSPPPQPWGTIYPTFKRREINPISCHGRPGTEITVFSLTYKAIEREPTLLDETRSATTSLIEKSIDEHPNLTEAQKLEAKRIGRNSYFQATITYSYTDTDAEFGWTQAEIVGTIGTTEAPTGMTGADAAKWLHNQRSITESEDETVTIKNGWQYDENGWQPGSY